MFGNKVQLVPSVFHTPPWMTPPSDGVTSHSCWWLFSEQQTHTASVVSETDSNSGNGCWSSFSLCKTLSRLVKTTDRNIRYSYTCRGTITRRKMDDFPVTCAEPTSEDQRFKELLRPCWNTWFLSSENSALCFATGKLWGRDSKKTCDENIL